MSQTIIKKLSVKTVAGAVNVPEEGKSITVCRFGGIARGLKTVPTTFGDSTALLGDFFGVNVASGEIFRSGVLYAPPVLLDMLAPRVEQNESVEFAFDVNIIGDKTVAAGYRYTLGTIIEPAENDPMQKLLGVISPAATALPSHAEKPDQKSAKKTK